MKEWRQFLDATRAAIMGSRGASHVSVVSGNRTDAAFWRRRIQSTISDTARADGSCTVTSIEEPHRMGNFLGTVAAWLNTRESAPTDTSVLMMVIGKGTRLSPFTQRLAGRKAAFPTPCLNGRGDTYLNAAELSLRCVAEIRNRLSEGGFRGVLVKWGDEAIIPGYLPPVSHDIANLDAVRFGWFTAPTAALAREKEWLVAAAGSGRLLTEVRRQSLETLQSELSTWAPAASAVNLGMFAISHRLLDALANAFRDLLLDPECWLDWDPYVWLALHCDNQHDWDELTTREELGDCRGIQEVEARASGFFQRVQQAKNDLRHTGDRPNAVVWDFGTPFWMDFGTHPTLREAFEGLTRHDEAGATLRSLFNSETASDARGNIIIRSQVPRDADIRESVLIDAQISDSRSHVSRGVVFGSRHSYIRMPVGGVSLFCDVQHIDFHGSRAIAFGSIGNSLMLRAGERHTSLPFPEGPTHLLGDESLLDYQGPVYYEPACGNALSFHDAGKRMADLGEEFLIFRPSLRWSSHENRSNDLQGLRHSRTLPPRD